MGEYAPDDQRTVHNNQDGNWQDKEDGGQAEQSQKREPVDADKDSQMGYGNARDTDGQMEQQAGNKRGEATSDKFSIDGAQPRETASDPAERARGDANRPLGGS